MRRGGLSSDKVRGYVGQTGEPVEESQVLAWASSTPADTVRMLLHKGVRDGGLHSRTLEDDTVLYWCPAPAKKRARVAETEEPPMADTADLDADIAALDWVDEAYVREVQGHMERLHKYNETKDAAQDLIGRIATVEGATVKSLYPRYGLEEDD